MAKQTKPTEQKKVAPLAKATNINHTNNIVQKAIEVKKGVKKSPKKNGYLKEEPTVNKILGAQPATFVFKIYDEQLPNGEDALYTAIKAIKITDLEIICIKHDKDTLVDDKGEVPTTKPHYHIIARYPTAKRYKQLKYRVRKVIELLGIVYRTDIDDVLIIHRGIETIKTSFSAAAMYLTHDTPNAQEAGKYQYDCSCFKTNLSDTKIKEIRAGYVAVSGKKKITVQEMANLKGEAYALGLSMQPYDPWFEAQPYEIQRHSDMQKLIKPAYQRGLDIGITDNPYVERLAVFIQGPANCGKTFNTIKALQELGKRTYRVTEGTGAFDTLTLEHDAIIIDDIGSTDILKITDNEKVKVHRRNNDDPYWVGDTVIVLTNECFFDWLITCGESRKRLLSKGKLSDVYTAYESRFNIIQLNEKGEIIKKQLASRGSGIQKEANFNRLKDFLKHLATNMVYYQSLKKEYDNTKALEEIQQVIDDSVLEAKAKLLAIELADAETSADAELEQLSLFDLIKDE